MTKGDPVQKEPTYEELERRVKRLEASLRNSEEKYRVTFESITDSITVTRISDGLYLYVNDGFCHQTGYSREEVLGTTPSDINLYANPGERERFIGILQKGGKAENVVVSFRRKNGEVYYSEFSAKPILYAGEECLLAQSRDITDRKRAENELRRKERYLSRILQTAMDGFVITDSIGRILEANPAYCRMTGYSETELLQMSIEDLECNQSPEEVKQQLQKTMDTGQDRFQSQHRGKDGTIIDVEVIVQFRKEGNGQFVSFIRDITSRKIQEKALSFQAMLLDQIQDFVTATDLDGKIIYINEASCKAIGKTRDEILGLSVESFGENPEKGATQQQIIEKTLAQGEWRGEVVNVAPDGSELIINCRTKLIRNESGDPVSMVGISTDVTEQKRLSEFVQHAQKMESIGNLAGGIAHDFNNILFPILGMSELLLEDMPADSLEHEKIRHILKAAERGSNLVQQILAFSRLSEHKMMPLGIQQVLKEALALIRSSIPTNIEISQNISKNCGLINGDPSQIHQVVMNLITNAYHAVEKNGGSIAVNLREISSELENPPMPSLRPGRYANLSVLDTGYGINPDHLEKIFEPYFTTKPKGKGTGFGLAVAYGIIKEHGGGIRVQSEPGKGSVFDVYLPLLKTVSEDESVVISQKFPTGTERILIVDDDNAVIQVEKQLLERLGYMVIPFTDSEGALSTFSSAPDNFDLVITDMAMPKMTGLEFAGKLVSTRPDIPVILCTGFSERIRERNIKHLPIKAFLKKPISKTHLANTVRDVLDGKPRMA